MSPHETMVSQQNNNLVESAKNDNLESHLPSIEAPSHSLQDLVHQASLRAYMQLNQFGESFPSMSDMDRKTKLLEYCRDTRNTFIKLLVAMRFKDKIRDLSLIQRIHAFVDMQDMAFAKTADDLFQIHGEMRRAKICNFDVLTAVDVLSTGKYQRLPSIIKKRFIQEEPSVEAETHSLKAKLNDLIRLKLVTSELLPVEFRKNMRIDNGTVTFTIPSAFALRCSLQTKQSQQIWKIVSIDILTKPKPHVYEDMHILQGPHIQAVGLKIQALLQTSNEPFMDVYTFLYDFCLRYKLEILIKQAQKLMNSSFWSKKISVEHSGRSMKIQYWLESVNKTGEYSVIIEAPSFSHEVKTSNQPTSNLRERVLESSLQALSSEASGPELIIRQCFTCKITGKQTDTVVSNDSFDLKTLDVQSIILKLARNHAANMLRSLYTIVAKEFSQDKIRLSIVDDSIRSPPLIENVSSEGDVSAEKPTYSESSISINYYGNDWINFSIDLRSGGFIVTDLDMQEGAAQSKLANLTSKMNVQNPSSIFHCLNYLASKTLASHVETLALSLDYQTVEPVSFPSRPDLVFPDPKDCIFLQEVTNPHYTLMISVDSAIELNASDAQQYNAKFYVWLICVKFAGAFAAQAPHVIPLSPAEVLDPISLHPVADHYEWTELDLSRLEKIQDVSRKVQLLLDLTDQFKKRAWDYEYVVPGLDKSHLSHIAALSVPRLARLNPMYALSPFSMCVLRKNTSFARKSRPSATSKLCQAIFTKPQFDCSQLYLQSHPISNTEPLDPLSESSKLDAGGFIHMIGRLRIRDHLRPYFSSVKNEELGNIKYDSETNSIAFEMSGDISLLNQILIKVAPVLMLVWWLSQVFPYRKSLRKAGISFRAETLQALQFVFHDEVICQFQWDPAKDRVSVSLDELSILGRIGVEFSDMNGQPSGLNVIGDLIEQSMRSDGNVLRALEMISHAYPVLHSMGTTLYRSKLMELGKIQLTAFTQTHVYLSIAGKYGFDIAFDSPDVIIFCDPSATKDCQFGILPLLVQPKEKANMTGIPNLRSHFASPLVEKSTNPQAKQKQLLGFLDVLEAAIPHASPSVWFTSLPHGLLLPWNPAVWAKMGTAIDAYANVLVSVQMAVDYLTSEPRMQVIQSNPSGVRAVVDALDGSQNAPVNVDLFGSTDGTWKFRVSASTHSDDEKRILSEHLTRKFLGTPFAFPILQNIFLMARVEEVMRELIQLCKHEEAGGRTIVAEWILFTPLSGVDEENAAYLPEPNSSGFLVEPAMGRMSLLVRYKDASSNQEVIVPFRYNYITGIVDLWRIKKDTPPIDSQGVAPMETDTQSPSLQEKCQDRTSVLSSDPDLAAVKSALATHLRSSQLNTMEKVLLHASSREVPANVESGLKLNLVVKHLRTQLSISDLRRESFELLSSSTFGPISEVPPA